VLDGDGARTYLTKTVPESRKVLPLAATVRGRSRRQVAVFNMIPGVESK
jgi:hypothetical protein